MSKPGVLRRLLSLALAAALLMGVATGALAAATVGNERDRALAHILAKHHVTAEQVELHEGGTFELEFTRESFWSARYVIWLSGKPGPDTNKTPPATDSGPARPVLTPEPVILPVKPGEPSATPGDPAIKGEPESIYGGIFIRLRTGELLEMDQMEAYWAAESTVAEREWARLRLEAGKLDVYLYRKLLTMSGATDTVAAVIVPAPVITKELLDQYATLQHKYPAIAKDLSLADALSGFVGGDSRTAPPSGGGGAEPRILIGAGDAKSPAIAPDVKLDEQYWRDSAAFWEQVAAMRLVAIAPSLDDIKAALGEMEISYRDDAETFVVADLAPDQARTVAELPSVATVYEDQVFTIMPLADGSVSTKAPGATDSAVRSGQPTLGSRTESTSGRPYLAPLLAGTIAVLAGAGGIVARRRRLGR
jgi:hypothetical protein